jgi:predicted Fe-S protein YdhL (DUF1289 family)
VESPCVKICVVHPEARICTGCLRTIDEIATWGRMTREERRAVMAELPDGKARAEGSPGWTRGAAGPQGLLSAPLNANPSKRQVEPIAGPRRFRPEIDDHPPVRGGARPFGPGRDPVDRVAMDQHAWPGRSGTSRRAQCSNTSRRAV